jgi:hypothetical protein
MRLYFGAQQGANLQLYLIYLLPPSLFAALCLHDLTARLSDNASRLAGSCLLLMTLLFLLYSTLLRGVVVSVSCAQGIED